MAAARKSARTKKNPKASALRTASSAAARRKRARPGERGGGHFFRITVRPRSQFVTFRTQDVGDKGGVERVAGRTAAGHWHTQAYLISKDLAHVERGRLVPDAPDAATVLNRLGASPRHTSGDRFVAKDRPNVPERAKPTPAQGRAIGKALETRRRRARK
jgi:hypothetical protein